VNNDYDVTRGYGTGAVPHLHDARDYQISRIPGVASINPEELAGRVSFEKECWHIYNQGVLPSCVSHSQAAAHTTFQRLEGEERIYDATSVYWEVGGDGRRGVPTATVLKYAKQKGFPVAQSSLRNPIAAYAYTRNPIDIAVALSLPVPKLCVFAMLLPSDFRNGVCKSMVRTWSYHQVLAVGYDFTDPKERRIIFANSWGREYGLEGFGSVLVDYLVADNYQQGYFYAYTMLDVIDGLVMPPPVAVVAGYQLTTGVPVPIGSEGLPVLQPGQQFVIVGKGFGQKIGTVRLGLDVLRQLSWSDTQIVAVAPESSVDITGKIEVLPAGTNVWLSGPQIKVLKRVVVPVPTPDPPVFDYDKYTLIATVRRFSTRKTITVRLFTEKSVSAGPGITVDLKYANTDKLIASAVTGKSGGVVWSIHPSVVGTVKAVIRGSSAKAVFGL
jgi:hypothetical protein